jgi:LysM repeat protein
VKKYIKKSVIVTFLVVMLLALMVPVASASGGNYHTVRYGETLYSIGRLYGVSPHYIADVNNLYNPDCIYAGQVLYIPTDYYDGCHQPCYDYDNVYYDGSYRGDYYRRGDQYWSNYHIVSYGETLSSIAYQYGVNPWSIARANNIYNLNRIYAGQRLYIPSDGYWGWSGYQGYY